MRFATCFTLAVALFGSVGCSSNDEGAPTGLDASAPLALGARHYISAGGAGLIYDILEQPRDLLQYVKSELFDKYAIVRVTEDYDISGVDALEPEHVLRLRTRGDSEVLSSWGSLRHGGGVGSHERVSQIYAVDLLFEAKASSVAEPGNGALEVDPAGDTLSVEWQYPSTGDVQQLDVELAVPPEP